MDLGGWRKLQATPQLYIQVVLNDQKHGMQLQSSMPMAQGMHQ